jgi:hypothetical protein
VAGIFHQLDVAEVVKLSPHQFDHIDAGEHSQVCIEASGQKRGRLRDPLAFNRSKLREIALGVAIAVERAAKAAVAELASAIVEIGLL